MVKSSPNQVICDENAAKIGPNLVPFTYNIKSSHKGPISGHHVIGTAETSKDTVKIALQTSLVGVQAKTDWSRKVIVKL